MNNVVNYEVCFDIYIYIAYGVHLCKQIYLLSREIPEILKQIQVHVLEFVEIFKYAHKPHSMCQIGLWSHMQPKNQFVAAFGGFRILQYLFSMQA